MGAKLDEDDYSQKKSKKIPQNVEIKSQKEHQLVFTFEKRNGKSITLVGKFLLSDNDKKEVLKLLKKKLACGGSINGEWIEIQGDKKEQIVNVLESDGWKFRKK
jgi:translation initiation factor 1